MKYIVVTGAAGFIGSNLAKRLNQEGFSQLIFVDHFDNPLKESNHSSLSSAQKIDRNTFLNWLAEHGHEVEFVFHIGARTDTAEFDFRVLDSLNLSYSKMIWEQCVAQQIPLLYASSAATYGLGAFGFEDDETKIASLNPLNAYGLSKQLFDVFVLEQKEFPPFWVGLKFFNVYGPNETHKGRMASVVFHAYKQIKETGKMNLFQSHHSDFNDGEQKRDFILVEDVVNICLHFYRTQQQSGIYNVGTGKARTFIDLAKAVFSALNLEPKIDFIPTPIDIRDKYQYFTEATTAKLRSAGFHSEFTSLEQGVTQYVNWLEKN